MNQYAEEDYIVVCDFVKSLLKDEDKAYTWMETKNPCLGGLSPVDMINANRTDKLVKFIQLQVDLSKPTEEKYSVEIERYLGVL